MARPGRSWSSSPRRAMRRPSRPSAAKSASGCGPRWGGLPELLRQAVLLVYFQGLKYQDAAEILGIPVGTVKSRLHAALMKLTEDWKGENQETGDGSQETGSRRQETEEKRQGPGVKRQGSAERHIARLAAARGSKR